MTDLFTLKTPDESPPRFLLPFPLGPCYYHPLLFWEFFPPTTFSPPLFFLSPAGENRLPTQSTVRRESGVSSAKKKRRGGGGGRAGISPLLPGFFCLPRGLGMEVSIVVNSSSSFRRARFFLIKKPGSISLLLAFSSYLMFSLNYPQKVVFKKTSSLVLFGGG